MSDLTQLSVAALAAAISRGEVRAVEAVESHAARIERRNGPLNAIVTLDLERARAEARRADERQAAGEPIGPLHGVPFTLKDSFETRGMRTTGSFPLLARHVPQVDSVVAERLRAAGGILLGKTNLPLLAMDWQTVSPLFGRTVNPHDAELTCGGSSGGSAAAVAARLTPFDVGSDLGGSIRLPAHFCGVFGLKATEGLVPGSGHLPDRHIPRPAAPQSQMRWLGAYGPIARSASDLAIVLSAIAGPHERDPSVPPVGLEKGAGISLQGCRVATVRRLPGLPSDHSVDAAIDDVVRAAAAGGATVEELEELPFDVSRAHQAWGLIGGSQLSAILPGTILERMVSALQAMPGRSEIRAAMLRGLAAEAKELVRALSVRTSIMRATDRFLERFDLLVCPVSAGGAFSHRETGALVEIDGDPVSYHDAVGGWTVPFNVSGSPVVTIPAGEDRRGLPIGLQLVARRYRDLALAELAGALAERLAIARQEDSGDLP